MGGSKAPLYHNSEGPVRSRARFQGKEPNRIEGGGGL